MALSPISLLYGYIKYYQYRLYAISYDTLSLSVCRVVNTQWRLGSVAYLLYMHCNTLYMLCISYITKLNSTAYLVHVISLIFTFHCDLKFPPNLYNAYNTARQGLYICVVVNS